MSSFALMTKSLLSFNENTSDLYSKEWMNEQINNINIRTCNISEKKKKLYLQSLIFIN